MRPDPKLLPLASPDEPMALASLEHVQGELATILNGRDSPFRFQSSPGNMRGIDFYPALELIAAVANTCYRFHEAHGRFPNLVSPSGFNERIVRAKFFRTLKVPECGNKLLTHRFIPESCAGEVRCAKVLWHSLEPRLPPNEAVKPGRYFLKASHGSRMNIQVTYPLSVADRTKLEETTRRWLSSPYGRVTGEWWYSCFRPEILLEEYLGDDRISFNYFCFRNKVALIVLHNHNDGETITLSPGLRLIGRKNGNSPPERFASAALLKKLARLASQIAAPFRFVRVDFFVKDDGEPILGEMTFSPGSGVSRRPDGVDEYLGKAWARVDRR